jgi:hypothetical protein
VVKKTFFRDPLKAVSYPDWKLGYPTLRRSSDSPIGKLRGELPDRREDGLSSLTHDRRRVRTELAFAAPTLPAAASTAYLVPRLSPNLRRAQERLKCALPTHLFRCTARLCPPLRLGVIAHELKIGHLSQVSPWQNGESRWVAGHRCTSLQNHPVQNKARAKNRSRQCLAKTASTIRVGVGSGEAFK